MFLKGSHNGQTIDNTSDKEVSAWLDVIKETQPREVMIYTIDRETPSKTIEKISIEMLNYRDILLLAFAILCFVGLLIKQNYFFPTNKKYKINI